MNVIFGDSLVKDVTKTSDKNNKVVTKHYSGAAINDIKSYIQPAISKNPE